MAAKRLSDCEAAGGAACVAWALRVLCCAMNVYACVLCVLVYPPVLLWRGGDWRTDGTGRPSSVVCRSVYG